MKGKLEVEAVSMYKKEQQSSFSTFQLKASAQSKAKQKDWFQRTDYTFWNICLELSAFFQLLYKP